MSGEKYGPAELQRDLGVSRETCERLETFVALLEIWSRRINLIGPRELDDVWRRHILDSAQLVGRAANPGRWIDIGAGAGFPGLVVACCLPAGGRVDLVEPNQKRAAFLREAVRATGAPAQVLAKRIEDVDVGAERWDFVTARAFAPLPRIIDSVTAILDSGAIGLFLKGAGVEAEIVEAAARWNYRFQTAPSLSDPRGRIVRIEGATRAR